MCKIGLCIAVLLIGVPMFGQWTPGFGTPSLSGRSNQHSDQTPIFLSGKVKAEDGGRLPQGATIVAQCGGDPKTLGYTDTDGNFSFQLTASPMGQTGVALASDSVSDSGINWQACDLLVELHGFATRKLQLASLVGSWGAVNLGTIVITRTEKAQGFTISAADMAAPPHARKAFEKGQQEEKKGKWAAAKEWFQKALAHYPQFAVAWLELGRVQTEQNDLGAARQSFTEALRADSRLSTAYLGLAQLSAREKNWPELANTTERMLQQADAVATPQPWYLNAIANFNMQRYGRSESSVLRAIHLDDQHTLPRAHYLLGLILATKHDYRGACNEISTYLSSSPSGADAAQAQEKLAEFEKLAGTPASVPLVAAEGK